MKKFIAVLTIATGAINIMLSDQYNDDPDLFKIVGESDTKKDLEHLEKTVTEPEKPKYKKFAIVSPSNFSFQIIETKNYDEKLHGRIIKDGTEKELQKSLGHTPQ